jgi:hypothetical protein
MPRGLFREPDGWVVVHHGKYLIAVPRGRYEASRYEPPYNQLPTRDEYVNEPKPRPTKEQAGEGADHRHRPSTRANREGEAHPAFTGKGVLTRSHQGAVQAVTPFCLARQSALPGGFPAKLRSRES